MKNIYKKLVTPIIVTLVVINFTACNKYETEPLDIIDNSLVYDTLDINGVFLQQRVNNLYTGLPNGFNRIGGLPLDAATDDAVPSNLNQNIEILGKSRITATSNPDNNWTNAYISIRNVNDYLFNEKKVPFSPQLKTYFRAEARFIRAMNYFELIKRYGGVPLIGDTLFNGNNLISTPRNTYEQCVQYIVSECDAIAGSLRTNSTAADGVRTGGFVGRISRGAAQALKARTLLYSASSLNNPSNILSRWTLAADAARAIINSTPAYSLMPSFSSLFVTRNTNLEIILGYQIAPGAVLERENAPIGYLLPNGSRGVVSPSQNLVDAFPGANGRPITESASIYNPLNPYANRDPRLSLTVFHNGLNWLGRPVETFDGGLDNPKLTKASTRTGYYQRKFLGDFANTANYANQQRSFPIFRYAEVLLNYAEAINEAADVLTNRTEAFNQLKALRLRAGIPIGTTVGYQHGLKTNMTQAEMRDAVRNERRIEMAFEEQRFWDIRRWKIADVVGNSIIRGVKIVKTSPTIFTYQSIEVDKLNFDPARNYLYPIPLNEITANPALNNQQNPGY